jgi:hypothetical protein
MTETNSRKNRWFSIVAFAVIVMALPASAFAWGLYGGIAVGGRLTDTDALNASLPSHIGTFSDGQYSLGYDINFLLMDNRLMLISEGRGMLSSRLVNGDVRGDMMSWEQTLKLGVIPWSTDNLLIYPLVGIGKHSARMNMSDFSTLTIAWASAKSLVLDVGFGVDYLMRTGGKGGLIIGIRGGYVFPLLKRYWTLDEGVESDLDIDVNRLPRHSGRGPYVSIIFGGGWFHL